MTLNAFDLFAEADLNAALAAKLINIRTDGAGLRILNYSDAAMYTPGAWTSPAVRHCRGLIVDDDWNVRARPWAKFFNHGQPEAGELDLDAPVEVTDKLDGSLGIVHLNLTGEPAVASRGSFESDQAIHATTLLREQYTDLINVDRVTPLVEIIYPANRIVVDYGDTDDLVLLGGVDIETGEYLSPLDTSVYVGWLGPIAPVFDYPTLRAALAAPPRPGMEGLCVRRLDRPHIVKIKQDDYIRLHRIVTGLSERSVWQHMIEGKPLTAMLDELPDELHDWTRNVWQRLDLEVADTNAAAEFAHSQILVDLPDGWTRRDYAAQAVRHTHLRPYLFNLLDGRDPRPGILKTLKPIGQTHARAYSEATA